MVRFILIIGRGVCHLLEETCCSSVIGLYLPKIQTEIINVVALMVWWFQPISIIFFQQDGCWFECRLRLAKLKCGCTPWHIHILTGKCILWENYPERNNYFLFQKGDLPLCDFIATDCFRLALHHTAVGKDCGHCLQDCEQKLFRMSSRSESNYFFPTKSEWYFTPNIFPI